MFLAWGSSGLVCSVGPEATRLAMRAFVCAFRVQSSGFWGFRVYGLGL